MSVRVRRGLFSATSPMLASQARHVHKHSLAAAERSAVRITVQQLQTLQHLLGCHSQPGHGNTLQGVCHYVIMYDVCDCLLCVRRSPPGSASKDATLRQTLTCFGLATTAPSIGLCLSLGLGLAALAGGGSLSICLCMTKKQRQGGVFWIHLWLSHTASAAAGLN
jgi:hypothetical protein